MGEGDRQIVFNLTYIVVHGTYIFLFDSLYVRIMPGHAC